MLKIAYLYPDLLNLYGESGNIKALTYMLDERGISFEITKIDLNDDIKFNLYDFVYIGSGRPDYLELVKAKLIIYKKDLLDYIKKNKVLLATGNSIYIMELLGLYKVEYYEKRVVADVAGTTSLCNGVIHGFQNTEYLIKDTSNILFSLESGFGNNNTFMEGFKKNNFYATSIIGPILARNDNLTNYIGDRLLENKGENK